MNRSATTPTQTLLDLEAEAIDGSTFRFSEYEGSTFLIVNTASKCGFTPHYRGLEALHREYKERGLVVVGFPCDQFGHQEPGDEAEIEEFCTSNYDVTFRLMRKIKVNGPDAHHVFRFLKARARGRRIPWNFTKFLVQSDGVSVTRFGPATTPERVKTDIEWTLDR